MCSAFGCAAKGSRASHDIVDMIGIDVIGNVEIALSRTVKTELRVSFDEFSEARSGVEELHAGRG